MSKLKKYLKSIAGGKKGYKKLMKSIDKESEKYGFLADDDLSSVAGGINESTVRQIEQFADRFGRVRWAYLLPPVFAADMLARVAIGVSDSVNQLLREGKNSRLAHVKHRAAHFTDGMDLNSKRR